MNPLFSANGSPLCSQQADPEDRNYFVGPRLDDQNGETNDYKFVLV